METNSPAKVKELLWEVLEIEPAKRREFLDNAGISAEIRSEIESLLSFEAASADFMSLAITDFSKDFTPETEADEISLIGQEIGVYQIVGELGFGGMGAVYLAERSDGKFAQKVAVKMLKREFNVEKIRRNFRREREILSKLNHPLIARLLDAGTTADGVPYLVMEFVEGLPIDKFCEAKNLSLKERLKLFNKVCEAVSFAHQNLIIHRDLKPSNIIVTDKGEPKLLDFGISKLLDAEDSKDKTASTLLGAMTPEYASPEQIKGETVSTATDIYSLGVVLYKILTGSLPYKINGKTNGDLLMAITEDEPTAPSFSLEGEKGRKGEGETRTKGEMKISSDKISPSLFLPFSPSQLKGDLDNIVLKALSKEPSRRYKTVEQFSADIWRHLDGLPISARRATVSYRASKFFRRNKLAVIAVSLIFLSLITGIGVAIRQTRLSAIESGKAKAEQAKSEKITKFMTKIIGYANPKWYSEGAKFGKDARVIDAILDLSEKIDVEFASEPDVAAELHHRFTDVIGTNGGSLPPEEQKTQRLFHAHRALELRKQFYGERHELVAKDMVYLYWAGGVEPDKKPQYLMEAIQMMRDTNPNNLNLPYMLEEYTARLILPKYEALHESYRNAVLPPTGENKYEIAEKMLRESLPVFRLHYKPDNSAVFAAECRLALALAKQKNRKDFDEHYSICKQYGEKSNHEKAAENEKFYVELIENALAAQKGETSE